MTSLVMNLDQIADPLLTRDFTKERLESLIVKFPSDDMKEPSEFFKNLTLFNKPKPINNKLEAYRDAMRRYGVEEVGTEDSQKV